MLIEHLKIEFGNLLEQKKEYYKILNNFVTTENKQFKIERWIQMELFYTLINKGYKVIPEYNYKECDLYIEKTNDHKALYLQIKDYVGSLQNFTTDIIGMRKDIEYIKGTDDSALLLLLTYNIRLDYEHLLNNYVENENELVKSKSILLLDNAEDQGIQYWVLYKKVFEINIDRSLQHFTSNTQ